MSFKVEDGRQHNDFHCGQYGFDPSPNFYYYVMQKINIYF